MSSGTSGQQVKKTSMVLIATVMLLSACSAGSTPPAAVTVASVPTEPTPESPAVPEEQASAVQPDSIPTVDGYPMPGAADLVTSQLRASMDPAAKYICSTYQTENTYYHRGMWVAVYKTGPQVPHFVTTGTSVTAPDKATYNTTGYFEDSMSASVYQIYGSEAELAAGAYPSIGVVGPVPVALSNGQCDPNSLIPALQ